MSGRECLGGEKPPTVAERIGELIESTPPPPGRKSRLVGRWGPHISKEDFAKVVQTGESQIKAWTHKTKPSYPDSTNRERLAAVSRGRYVPDDFKREAELSLGARLEEVAATAAQDQIRTRELLQQAIERIRLLERRVFGEEQSGSGEETRDQ